jgi:arabinose-5-phosphate isomerase
MIDVVPVVKRTLHTQAAALLSLAEDFDENAFSEAVDLLFLRGGRNGGCIITTGVGKSGNIAAKVASTLASTGNRAWYLDPLDAVHGGLGRIRPDDTLIVFSKSGETYEIIDMLSAFVWNQVPCILITCREDSYLSRTARVVICYDAPECCGIGMIPTTSSTLALAIGDALAVALIRYNNFTLEEFSRFHPGGELGQIARDSIGKVDFNETCQ